MHVIDKRATPAQRDALSRILRGEDTEPFATVFNVFASTCDTLHEPLFELDIEGRTARAKIADVLEMRGAPILNPVTGAEHWAAMMVAMMLPSAAPTVLLYARVARHAEADGHDLRAHASIAAFASGYLTIWILFSLLAVIVHWGLSASARYRR